MSKKLLFSVFIVTLFAASSVFSGITGKISGSVKDAETGAPLPGMNIVISGTTIGTASDINGNYYILNVPPGVYTLEASMIGYKKILSTDVWVKIDRTILVDFDLELTTIAGEEVTVVAEREIVPMDVSSSLNTAVAEKIIAVPAVRDVAQFLGSQVGIESGVDNENLVIRGGGMNQTGLMVDGLSQVDRRRNAPTLSSVNLSAIKEVSILTGGFNAEYGNIRSGMINVVTKEGGQRYHGSVDYRYSPSAMKHFGPSWYSQDFYFQRPYVDPAICWDGTDSGAWSEEMQRQYPSFKGWNKQAEDYNSGKPENEQVTAQDLRNVFMWRHFTEGGPRPLEDGKDPDHYVDGSFGGPVPFIGKYLGDLSFFVSGRFNKEMFPYSLSRDAFEEGNYTLKLTSNITPSIKLRFSGGHTDILSAAYHNSIALYYRDPNVLLRIIPFPRPGSGWKNTMYANANLSGFDLNRDYWGADFTHTLSPSTFYEIKVNQVISSYNSQPLAPRNTSVIRNFGNFPVDETPLGHDDANIEAGFDGMRWSAWQGAEHDSSKVTTTTVRADIVSQINKSNQVKAGVELIFDNYDIKRMWGIEAAVSDKQYWDYDNTYKQFCAYIQDKLEVKGFIANFGVRADYNNPGVDWPSVDQYSKYLTAKWEDDFWDVVPQEPAKKHLKLSPRLGISHPITANAKLYFNYGHFYSMPNSNYLYDFRRHFSRNVTLLGNPDLELERTIAYELGYDHNILDILLLRLNGYYKDVSEQTSVVSYHNFAGTVEYDTYENSNYADIRGFELSLEKMYGRWVTGWLNFNYMVITSGFVGRRHYYEDIRLQLRSGMQEPNQSRPIARPSFRANVNFRSPKDWGPMLGGFKPLEEWQLSLLYQWKEGDWVTYNPNDVRGISNNVQLVGFSLCNARLSKTLSVKYLTFDLYVDVQNVFNQKVLNVGGGYPWFGGFSDDVDLDRYMESLNLPESEAYDNPVGDDRIGQLKDDDHDYIDNPNIENSLYRIPRDIWLGIRVNF